MRLFAVFLSPVQSVSWASASTEPLLTFLGWHRAAEAGADGAGGAQDLRRTTACGQNQKELLFSCEGSAFFFFSFFLTTNIGPIRSVFSRLEFNGCSFLRKRCELRRERVLKGASAS